MGNKIGTFFMIMLVLCAVLMLAAAAGRNDQEPGETTGETTVQTTAPTAETQPPTESQPEQTGDTQTTEPPAVQAPAAKQLDRVKEIVDREKLTATAASHRVYAAGLHEGTGARAHASDSYGYALGRLAGERAVNPIAAFWELVGEGLYSKEKDTAGVLSQAASMVPEHGAKSYAADLTGARALLEDLLTLANRMYDDLALEQAILGSDGKLEEGQVHWSREDGCYYAYFTVSSERSTHILCFYLRGEDMIDDVEFQLLNLRHAEGDGEDRIDAAGDRQAVTLMAAAELLLTGTHRAGQPEVPFAYTLGTASAKIDRYGFASTGELGVLTNYRLQK